MSDEAYEIEFVSKTDNMTAGSRKVVADLDKVTEATKRAAQAVDGLVKKFEKLAAPQQLQALAAKRKELENIYAATVASSDPKRASKLRALRGAFDTIDSRSAILSASTGISAPRGASGSGSGGSPYYGMAGGFRSGAAEGGLVGGLVGGIVGGITMGLVHAIVRVVKAAVDIPFKARDMTASAKAEEETIRKVFEWSEGARENVSMLANMWTAFTSLLSKTVTEASSLLIVATKTVTGLAEMNVGKLLGRGLGGALANRGETLLQQAIATAPTWLGGLGGTGESGVIEAESMLAKAQNKRKEKDQKAARDNREKQREEWNKDYAERKEKFRMNQYQQAVQQTQDAQNEARSRMSSNGLYAAGGDAALRAFWDESNNIARSQLAELKEINKKTQMPLTESDIENAGIRMF